MDLAGERSRIALRIPAWSYICCLCIGYSCYANRGTVRFEQRIPTATLSPVCDEDVWPLDSLPVNLLNNNRFYHVSQTKNTDVWERCLIQNLKDRPEMGQQTEAQTEAWTEVPHTLQEIANSDLQASPNMTPKQNQSKIIRPDKYFVSNVYLQTGILSITSLSI